MTGKQRSKKMGSLAKALSGLSTPKHGPEPYEIVRSDGKTEEVTLTKGSKVEAEHPGIPEGVVFSVRRKAGQMKRFYVVAAGCYLKVSQSKFVDLWHNAKAG